MRRPFNIVRRLTSPALILLLLAFLVGLASAFGIYPAQIVARCLSPDGHLSAELIFQLHRSQQVLALSLGIVGIAAGLSTPLLYHPLRIRKTMIICGAGSAFAVLLIQTLYFENIPHVTDAISQWFQARILASGNLVAPLPPCWKVFAHDNLIMSPDGRWFTKYFPGHSLWLSLFWAMRMRWASGPAATALIVGAIATLARPLGLRTTVLATFLAASSPLLLLLGASYMSHITATMWLALSFALFAQTSMRPLLRWAAGGFCAGMALITRPQDAVVAYAVVAAAGLPRRLRRPGSVLRPMLLVAGGVLPPMLFLVAWNQALYRAPIATGYNIFGRGVSSLAPIINDSLGFSSAFTVSDAFEHMLWTTLRFNKALFGWPTSLLFIPFALLLRPSRRTWTIAGIGLALWLLYFFFPYYGFEYEARYLAPVAVVGILLTADGAKRFYELTRKIYAAQTLAQKAELRSRQLTAGIIGAGILYSWLYYWPTYIFPRYADNYEFVGASVHRICSSNVSVAALILLPATGEDHFRYGSGLVFTDPFLRSRLIYARDLPEELPCIMTGFPDRAVYRFLPEDDWRNGRLARLRGPLTHTHTAPQHDPNPF